MKHTAIFLALALALAVPAAGQTSAPFNPQAAVLADEAVPPPQDVRTTALPRIQKGKRITVELHKNLGGKVKGAFVGSDADGISVRANDGQVRTVAWESVRSIKPRRSRKGLWIGMAAGAAFAGTALLFDDAPAELGLTAASIAAGTGVGGLAGATVDPREPAIYEAPRGEDTALAK
jgi:hypothetical protein